MHMAVKSRLVLPFWHRLTWVVPEKRPLNGCVCVCVLPPYRISHSRQTPTLTSLTLTLFTHLAPVTIMLVPIRYGGGWHRYKRQRDNRLLTGKSTHCRSHHGLGKTAKSLLPEIKVTVYFRFLGFCRLSQTTATIEFRTYEVTKAVSNTASKYVHKRVASWTSR